MQLVWSETTGAGGYFVDRLFYFKYTKIVTNLHKIKLRLFPNKFALAIPVQSVGTTLERETFVRQAGILVY